MFSFLTNRSFLTNLIVALVLGFAAVFIFFQLLDMITKHGDYIKVPQVKGQTIESAKKLLLSQGFQVEVQDSVYYDSLPKLSVVKQSPAPDELVKINRTVYLTINRAEAPLVAVPNFVGQTYRSVQLQLNTLGLKLGDTSSRPDFAVGSVLEQLYNGNNIVPGSKIPMGSSISLVLGGGIKQKEMMVPDLLGMTFAEAKVFLESNELLLGAVIVDGNVGDSSNAFVIKQSPARRDEEGRPIRIRGGQLMDLYISMDRTKIDSIQKPKAVMEKKENEY
ncbi:MAG: PASTA domain-containing protein [Chitinophagaceae bacterium]|nr:PASTA domain-containing protein [Chitinophagaceae bacterium]